MDENKRETAFKVNVKDILDAPYVQQEGWDPNYIVINNQHISKINLIGNIIQIEDESTYELLILDDGSGVLSIRAYNKNLKNFIAIGDFINVIGQPRIIGDQKFILGDIIRKLPDEKWLLFRNLELKKKDNFVKEKTKEIPSQTKDKKMQIYETIKSLDSGNGVAIEDVIKKEGLDVEPLIQDLLQNGDIFEISPGIIKPLE